MRLTILLVSSICLAQLAGCAGTLGLDQSSYACKAPDGVSCTSLSGVHANLSAKPTDQAGIPRGGVAGVAPSAGTPLRSHPSVLRIWLAPWEDADGDLHDQSYVYVVADPGRWAVAHHQKRTVEAYLPTFLKRPAANAPAKPAAAPNDPTARGPNQTWLPAARQGHSDQEPEAD